MDRQIRKKEFLLRSYMHTYEAERKTYYEIPPRRNFNGIVGILISMLLVAISSLIVLKNLLYIQDLYFYIGLFFSISIVIWRLSLLKVILLEISKHSLLIKYTHPIKQAKYELPTLEIPLSKLESFKITREFFVYYLEISRRSERGNGVKNFYFRLGVLSEKQMKNIRKIINTIDDEIIGI
ncbi:MAG: hypothetical protein P0Y62_02755 [Candidatus Chryseobacterium colombiense]|nr:hypothetical protein [Chryseobacterium sp.]WEK70476.1 MAG: hypothetical protein P0Y62_02755 [Chryseobacterium sp.]